MAGYRARFVDAIADDLAMPAALAVAHEVAAADDLSPAQRRALLLDFDRVLGLDLDAPAEPEVGDLPEGAAELLERRARRVRTTSRPPTRCATSSPPWGSRCATRPTAR